MLLMDQNSFPDQIEGIPCQQKLATAPSGNHSGKNNIQQFCIICLFFLVLSIEALLAFVCQ